jgi:hypothetical protein
MIRGSAQQVQSHTQIRLLSITQTFLLQAGIDSRMEDRLIEWLAQIIGGAQFNAACNQVEILDIIKI